MSVDAFDEFALTSCDGALLACYVLLPEGAPRAVVQISHGMAEHATRYVRLAQFLLKKGYAVYAHDHRGHGKTSAGDMQGHFADTDGIKKAVADIRIVATYIHDAFPDVPHVLFGHSMGSFLARKYAAEFGDSLSGLIISGTGGDPGVKGFLARCIARADRIFYGARTLSPQMDKLLFGNFNRAFFPNRTAFDWLSRDNQEVDDYINDPLCGFICTTQFYADLLSLVSDVSRIQTIERVPRSLPVLFISGDRDPVGNNGKGVTTIYARFKKTGVNDVTLHLYPSARHELTNEINRHEIFQDIAAWLDVHISTTNKKGPYYA